VTAEYDDEGRKKEGRNSTKQGNPTRSKTLQSLRMSLIVLYTLFSLGEERRVRNVEAANKKGGQE